MSTSTTTSSEAAGGRSLVDRAAAFLDRRTSRRGFLARSAVVGSALAVAPGAYVLRPGTAYAAVCGSDATCDAGYTIFCATINNGVNRCPPGALVGGWWKADNSGFCCGSARYYIDCHSYCSCGCGPGVQFCGEGCRNCRAGCGPSSSCDQRRVCTNDFRYGQCNQDVGCTGPVWCRVVTCTPPWRIPAWDCTSTSATDNRTGSHTAPGLPYCTAIDAKYTGLGGAGSFLGEPVTGEVRLVRAGGAFTHYDGGSIYWSPGSGAHEVHGQIRATWSRLGWENGPLGYPVTDETPTPDRVGRYNHFTGSGAGPAATASVYWTPATGAHAVYGAIRGAWERLGWEGGPLGYPVTDETGTPDGVGRYNHFTAGSTTGQALGSVYWTPATGAHAVYGAIRAAWERLGWENGPLGYPVTDELPAARGGRYNDFTGRGTAASIYWGPTTGAHAVLGAIRGAWLAGGGAAGGLGLPTTDEYASGPLLRSDFTGGWITYDPATRTTTVHRS